jgi:four helix bundle protein
MKTFFEHETLPVYQESLDFVKWSDAILERTPKNSAMYEQLDQGRTAIPLKIAAANGKVPAEDRARYFEMAQRAALETAACLDLLFNRRILSKDELERGKEALQRIAATLAGRGKSGPGDGCREEAAAAG